MIPDDESDSIPWLVCLSDTPITTPRDYTEAFIWLSKQSRCLNQFVIGRLEQETSFGWLSIELVSLTIHSGSFNDDKLRRPSYSFFDEDENDFNILVNTEKFQSNLLKLIELFRLIIPTRICWVSQRWVEFLQLSLWWQASLPVLCIHWCGVHETWSDQMLWACFLNFYLSVGLSQATALAIMPFTQIAR